MVWVDIHQSLWAPPALPPVFRDGYLRTSGHRSTLVLFAINLVLSGRTRHTVTGTAGTTGAGQFGDKPSWSCYLPSLDFGMRVLSWMDGLGWMLVSRPSIMD